MFVPATTSEVLQPPHSSFCSSLHIGGITLALRGASSLETRVNTELLSFLDDNRTPDIEVTVEFVDFLQRDDAPALFDSGALWRVFAESRGFRFEFASELLGHDPYKLLIVDRDFSSAQILLNERLLSPFAPVFPLEYPTDELLITNHLAFRRTGVEVHGCGLIDFLAGGQLLLGHSGAGKSTTTQLWKAMRNPIILSDDRIILRLESGNLRMYGTPWHGEAAFAEQGNTCIRRIFILQHGLQNRIRLLPKSKAIGEVFARCFPPFHSAEGLEGALDFITRMLNNVPCYEFHFVPNPSAVNSVLEFHD